MEAIKYIYNSCYRSTSEKTREKIDKKAKEFIDRINTFQKNILAIPNYETGKFFLETMEKIQTTKKTDEIQWGKLAESVAEDTLIRINKEQIKKEEKNKEKKKEKMVESIRSYCSDFYDIFNNIYPENLQVMFYFLIIFTDSFVEFVNEKLNALNNFIESKHHLTLYNIIKLFDFSLYSCDLLINCNLLKLDDEKKKLYSFLNFLKVHQQTFIELKNIIIKLVYNKIEDYISDKEFLDYVSENLNQILDKIRELKNENTYLLEKYLAISIQFLIDKKRENILEKFLNKDKKHQLKDEGFLEFFQSNGKPDEIQKYILNKERIKTLHKQKKSFYSLKFNEYTQNKQEAYLNLTKESLKKEGNLYTVLVESFFF